MSGSSKIIRIGILGTASIAVRSIVPAIKSLPEHYQLVGIATRKAHEKKISEVSLLEGYENLVNLGSVDAIYIPLPASLHYEWVKRSLGAGLHVLVEKPMACKLSETVELNHIAQMRNLVLLENFQFRKHSQLSFIQSVLSDEKLGDLRVFRSTFCFPPFADANNIRYVSHLGGGALLDAGAYPLKASQIFLGNDLDVVSAKLNSSEGHDVDTWGGAFLKQRNGPMFSQIAFGFDHYYQCNIEIIGSKGRLFTNRIFTAGDSVKPKVVIETSGLGMEVVDLPEDHHFKNMLSYFYDLICGKASRSNEYIDNINQSRLIEEIREKSNG